MAVNHSEADAVERCSENCEPTRAGPSMHYRTQSRGQAGIRIFLQLFPTAGAAQPRHVTNAAGAKWGCMSPVVQAR